MAKLETFCNINMGQSPGSTTYNTEGKGLPFFQGNADFGEIHPKTRIWCSAPTKVANAGDILISVRAPIGALNIANEKCCIGRGLSALTVNHSVCDQTFLWYALSSKIDELNSKGTGSTFKAINKKALGETEIFLPPLDEQYHIAAILDKVTDLIAKRRAQLDKLDLLVKSRFVEMFGDPACSTRWPTKKLSQLGELNRGVSKHRPRNDPALLGGPYPLIQTGDVSNSGVYITEYSASYSELGLAQSRLWKTGTLCITIAANIAQTSILTFDSCFPDSVVGFIPSKKTNAIFMHYWFGFFQKILEEQAPQVAQKNINLKILSDLDVIVPPFDLQNKFAQFVSYVNIVRKDITCSYEKLQEFQYALQQNYFLEKIEKK